MGDIGGGNDVGGEGDGELRVTEGDNKTIERSEFDGGEEGGGGGRRS